MMIRSENPAMRQVSHNGIFVLCPQKATFITFLINFKTPFPIDLFCAIICKMVMIL